MGRGALRRDRKGEKRRRSWKRYPAASFRSVSPKSDKSVASPILRPVPLLVGIPVEFHYALALVAGILYNARVFRL